MDIIEQLFMKKINIYVNNRSFFISHRQGFFSRSGLLQHCNVIHGFRDSLVGIIRLRPEKEIGLGWFGAFVLFMSCLRGSARRQFFYVTGLGHFFSEKSGSFALIRYLLLSMLALNINLNPTYVIITQNVADFRYLRFALRRRLFQPDDLVFAIIPGASFDISRRGMELL